MQTDIHVFLLKFDMSMYGTLFISFSSMFETKPFCIIYCCLGRFIRVLTAFELCILYFCSTFLRMLFQTCNNVLFYSYLSRHSKNTVLHQDVLFRKETYVKFYLSPIQQGTSKLQACNQLLQLKLRFPLYNSTCMCSSNRAQC